MENSFQALRKAAGLTLKEAEAMAGYSVATISALENDNRGSDRLKQKLLEIYGQSTGELREPAPAYRVAAPPPAHKNVIEKLRRQVHNLQAQIDAINETLDEL